jgi:hypothetical protein
MEACDEKEVEPITGEAPVIERVKRAYVKPALVDFGDVRELTRGSGGTSADFNGSRRAPRG